MFWWVPADSGEFWEVLEGSGGFCPPGPAQGRVWSFPVQSVAPVWLLTGHDVIDDVMLIGHDIMHPWSEGAELCASLANGG